MIDFEHGWRAVPGMFNVADGTVLQRASRMCRPGTAIVELGAWCGRSLASICEVVPGEVAVFSYDNYLEDSQANDAGSAPIPPSVALRLRELVAAHYRTTGVDVTLGVKEASLAGREYDGPPVSLLFVDDHHSAEQVKANFDAWLPRCADRVIILLHDYAHPPYRIKETCEAELPKLGFAYWGQPFGSGIGIWGRKVKP